MLIIKWLALPDILLIGVLAFCVGPAVVLFVWWSLARAAKRGDR